MQELESRRRRRVPRDGGDADSHQVEDAAAAAGDGGRRRRRGGRSARRAGAAAARAPEVQGGGRACCTSASSCARRSGSGPTSRVADIAGDDYEPELEVDLFSLLTAFQAVVAAREAAAEGAAAARADVGRGAHRAAARAAVGNRGLRLRGAVRRRRRSQRPDRHVSGAARDDSAEAGEGLSVRAASARSASTSARGRPMRRIRLAIRRAHRG